MIKTKLNALVRIRETTHTRHDTENVVVGSIDTHLASTIVGNGTGSEGKLKGSVVNTRHVARAAGLMLFGFKPEGVNIDTGSGAVGVVLVRLNQVEVATFASGKSVVAVELDLGMGNGVVAAIEEEVAGRETDVPGGSKSRVGNSVNILVGRISEIGVGCKGCGNVAKASTSRASRKAIALVNYANISDLTIQVLSHRTSTTNEGAWTGKTFTERGARSACQGGKIKGIGVVEPLGTTDRSGSNGINVQVGLNNPDEFLNRVVEVEFDLVGGGVDRFSTSELELFNEVFVRSLGKASAFIGVKVYVIDKKGSGFEVNRGSRGGVVGIIIEPEAAAGGAEFEVDLNFVVLKSD